MSKVSYFDFLLYAIFFSGIPEVERQHRSQQNMIDFPIFRVDHELHHIFAWPKAVWYISSLSRQVLYVKMARHRASLDEIRVIFEIRCEHIHENGQQSTREVCTKIDCEIIHMY